MASNEVNHATRQWPQYVAALAACGGALAAGTALGWTSPANPKLTNATDDTYDFTLTTEAASWVGSSLNLGAAAVCIPIGILINLIGRKWSMLSLVIWIVRDLEMIAYSTTYSALHR